MPIKLIDPFDEPHFAEAQEAPELKGPPASVIAGARKPKAATKRKAKATTALTSVDPYGREQILMDDFRQFLAVIWEFLGLPEPSEVQLALAWWLQHGPNRAIILGFRGMAKSWITGAYCLWKLYRDPQTKVLVVSASLERAVGQVQWCLALIREMPELAFLQPGPNQRSSAKSFDVGPATPDQSPSMKGVGITGQLAGSRAHVIVPDDVEIPANSMTVDMREKISEGVKEFDAVLHPNGEVKFLGTPQVDDSLYVKLQSRGYVCRIWPARFPDKKMRLKYGDRLSPWVTDMIDSDPTLVGKSVWPSRFTELDLQARELSYGRSGFALQFMLDTSLADADRYPLKLRDLITMALDPQRGPEHVAWSNDHEKVVNDMPIMGFEGDRFYGPASVSERFSPYTSIKAALDTSGRGSNQTSLSIVAELNSRLFFIYNEAWRDGYAVPTLRGIAAACVTYKVQELIIEGNFGDGMFISLFKPVLEAAWKAYNKDKPEDQRGGTSIVEITSGKTQKELRILSVLEPCTQQHRLVVSTSVIFDDQKDIRRLTDDVGSDAVHNYSLFHQYTHLSRDKDSLLQDDKIESLAMVVGAYSDLLAVNPWDLAAQREDDLMAEEFDRLMSGGIVISGEDIEARGGSSWDRSKTPIRPARR
jgi:hypothetical protein